MFVNNGLLTKGLGVGLPAYASLIISRVSLSLKIKQQPKVTGVLGGGGGGGSIKIIPQILNGEDQSLLDHPIFIDEPRKINDLLTITLKFGSKTFEKEYIVPKNKIKNTIKIINIINSTNNLIKINIKNIKELKNKLFAKITNIKNIK